MPATTRSAFTWPVLDIPGGRRCLYYAMISLYVSYVEIPGLDRFLGEASAVNARGDEVTAETECDGTAGFRAKTVIKFKPAHHWFATTLLVARSNNSLVGFKWRDDDRLVLDSGLRLWRPHDRSGTECRAGANSLSSRPNRHCARSRLPLVSARRAAKAVQLTC